MIDVQRGFASSFDIKDLHFLRSLSTQKVILIKENKSDRKFIKMNYYLKHVRKIYVGVSLRREKR